MPDQNRNAYGPTGFDPFAPDIDTVTLQRLRAAVQVAIGPAAAHDLRMETMRYAMGDAVLAKLETALLAEELPPLEVVDEQRFTVPRFASPWQHFKARYRERWWMWLLRDFGFMREIRYVDEPHTHTAEVDVRTHWTYPRATTVLPGSQFGHPVLKAQARQSGAVRPW